MPANGILPVGRLPEALSAPGGYLDVGVCPGASAMAVLEKDEPLSKRRLQATGFRLQVFVAEA